MQFQNIFATGPIQQERQIYNRILASIEVQPQDPLQQGQPGSEEKYIVKPELINEFIKSCCDFKQLLNCPMLQAHFVLSNIQKRLQIIQIACANQFQISLCQRLKQYGPQSKQHVFFI